MTKHTYEKHDRCPDPDKCPICDGGLAVCTICGCAEGGLPTECPGVRCGHYVRTAIGQGRLDFVGGRFVVKAANN